MLTYMDGGKAITPTSSRSTDSTNTDTQPGGMEHAYTAASVDSLLAKLLSSKEMRGSADSSAAGAETALLAVSFFLALSLAMLRMM